MTGAISPTDVALGTGDARDVDEFLLGMMLLSEVARRAGLFTWLAARAVRAARGSAFALFALVYAAGTLVTVVMSNDATAVVLTPAVATALRAALPGGDLTTRARPYLFACAFVANAASFVLPISNPANLVVFGRALPPLGRWLPTFALPSLAAILATFAVLALLERRRLVGHDLTTSAAGSGLDPRARLATAGVALAAVALSVASALGAPLGPPSLVAGSVVLAAVAIRDRPALPSALRGVSWGTLVLVAALFVLVRGADATALPQLARAGVFATARLAAPLGLAIAAAAPALLSNLANNLPVGLFTGAAVAHVTCPAAASCESLRAAAAIGVDLGPNLAVTGSLATLLWLEAIEREGFAVDAWRFFRVGAVAMPVALAAAIAALVR